MKPAKLVAIPSLPRYVRAFREKKMTERLAQLTERMRRVESQGEFLKYCWALARHCGDAYRAHAEVGQRFGHNTTAARVLKSAIAIGDTTSAGWASELADYKTLTNEWVSLLSARTVLGRVPFRRVNFNTRTIVETASGTAGWVGQGLNIPASRMTLNNAQVDYSKFGGIVFFTEEMLESWNAVTASQINSAMLNVLGRFTDVALLTPEISAVTGKNPASITSGITPTASTGSTEAAITANIKTLLAQHTDAGADPADIALIMHPSTALHLSTLLTAGSTRAFPDVGINGGEVFGVPVLTSPGAVSVGSPSERLVIAVNAKGVIVADDGGILVAASRNASVQMLDAPGTGAQAQVSMLQTNSVAMKFIRTLNFARVADGAVSVMRVGY